MQKINPDLQAELRNRYKKYCRQHNKVIEHNDTVDDEFLRLIKLRELGVRVEIKKPNYLAPPSMQEEFFDLTCGAKTRAGTPCKLKTLYDSGRCKFHGGLSTGAKTDDGKKRQRRDKFGL